MSNFFSSIKNLFSSEKSSSQTSKKALGNNLVTKFIGTVCKILDSNNQCYFIGQADEYDSYLDELKVIPYRRDTVPLSVDYGTAVKVQIQRGSTITIIHGSIKRQSPRFWWVHMESIEQYENRRDEFRQVLTGRGIIMRDNGESTDEIPCKLVDISLTGICIACEEEFQISDKIVIADAFLSVSAKQSYTFECIICRSFQLAYGDEDAESEDNTKKKDNTPEEADSQLTYYGCAFENLIPAEHDRLYQDIFLLQKQERSLST